MALSFLKFKPSQRTQIVAVDLGSRATKAVHLQRKGGNLSLMRYAIRGRPAGEANARPAALAEHLRQVMQALEVRTRPVLLAVGVTDSLLRIAELPLMPVSDMRLMLKFNPKNYLQQDLEDYVFDCFVLPMKAGAGVAEAGKAGAKCRVLVGGAKRAVLADLQTAGKGAGLTVEMVVPALIGPCNAFERAQPEAFAKDSVALVDLGFRNSSVTILRQGELMLNRVVAFGGDQITHGLAEQMGVNYAEAEAAKIGRTPAAEPAMQAQIVPLGRELRASIDFFEHQYDQTVSQVFVSGGPACSEFLVQTLQSELMAPCKTWDPTAFLENALPPQQRGEIEQVAPQLTAVIGAALTAF